MVYVRIGLVAVIFAILLLFTSDSPGVLERSEVLGLIVLGAGGAAVLIGMITHVIETERADATGDGRASER